MDRVTGQSIRSWYEFRKDESRRLPEHMGYQAWLETAIDRCLRRALTQPRRSWGDPIHFLVRRLAIGAMVADLLYDKGCFVKHGDLHELNIMADSLRHLTGVVDWDFAANVPLAAAVHFPSFLADIPGWNTPDRPDSYNFFEDRQYLIRAVRAQYNDHLADCGRVLQLLETSFERQFFELSLSIKVVNHEYVRLRGGDPLLDAPKAQLAEHLRRFLDKDSDLGDAQEVLFLTKRLQ
ncbi:hypothetical protein ANO11243_024890 [Dothideomycetidae sp. 11243]|nr:hypothetical protein ANO11243_024890 [fungal sp. No.11243]